MTCDQNGAQCRPGCQEVIDKFRASPCFQDPYALDNESYFAEQDFYPDLKDLRYYLRSCNGYDVKDDDRDDEDNRTEQGPRGSQRYDPDLNGLPIDGVCPFIETSEASHIRPLSAYFVLSPLFVVLRLV